MAFVSNSKSRFSQEGCLHLNILQGCAVEETCWLLYSIRARLLSCPWLVLVSAYRVRAVPASQQQHTAGWRGERRLNPAYLPATPLWPPVTQTFRPTFCSFFGLCLFWFGWYETVLVSRVFTVHVWHQSRPPPSKVVAWEPMQASWHLPTHCSSYQLIAEQFGPK